MKSLTMIALAAPLLAIAAGATGSTSAAPSTAISTAHGHLVDQNGMSLYLFEPDEHKASTCYQACAQVWPPLVDATAPATNGATKASMVGSVKRKNGSIQVTYGGWPLYHFANDTKPGETAGQGVKSFGGEWYLVEPNGKPKE
jgi:predicted lipoprotein with Yx(FWY)xxD motif